MSRWGEYSMAAMAKDAEIGLISMPEWEGRYI
jgi:hypothetical protein